VKLVTFVGHNTPAGVEVKTGAAQPRAWAILGALAAPHTAHFAVGNLESLAASGLWRAEAPGRGRGMRLSALGGHPIDRFRADDLATRRIAVDPQRKRTSANA
jgi:hypothetical protein